VVQGEVEAAAQAAEPSVVQVTSIAGRQEAIGSGDILSSDGFIVTNDHVVRGFRTFTVTLANGTSHPAQVVGQDPQDDLAVLKITSSTALQPIAFADSSMLQVGAFAVAIGHPLGLSETATLGIVSALNQSVSEAPDGPAGALTGLVETTAPLNPGNSGGALVNLQGQLVGIPTLSILNAQTNTPANGIGFAIPSNRVRAVATQLMQQGQVTSSGQGTTSGQGFLGIQGQDVTARVAAANGLRVQRGVLVTDFLADSQGQSPAKQAGVRMGDVVTAVAGQPIANISDLTSAARGATAGSTVTVALQRGAVRVSVAVMLGARPANN
jgi:S1-C subfamily serine protease